MTADQIRTGMHVVALDGEPVGEVKEIRNDAFLVNRPLKTDIFVPYTDVERVESGNQSVVLKMPKWEVDRTRFDIPPL
ncbi:DUF2171 domain-containing protein [Nitrolancea hollandica]|uniref:Heat shock protein Hsp20 n=1 Tax=Nitrolancea hollandica Lb TaxID=1129897 RepID=I4ELQ0_9BACT